MSLIVCVDNPNIPSDQTEGHFMEAAGFEDYRTELWGTEPIKKRSPLLAQIEDNLYLLPEQFAAFEEQCRIVEAQADDVARELTWREGGGEQIRRYMRRFLDAVAFARKHGSDHIDIY